MRQRLCDLTVTCRYCKIICVGTGTRDHVIPTSKAKKYSPKKWVYACRACNQAKGDLTLEQFKQTEYWRINVKSRKWKGVRLEAQHIT